MTAMRKLKATLAVGALALAGLAFSATDASAQYWAPGWGYRPPPPPPYWYRPPPPPYYYRPPPPPVYYAPPPPPPPYYYRRW